MITTESYQRRVSEILELTMRNDRLVAAVKVALACPTYSEQTNAIVIDAKTAAKLRDAIAPWTPIHIAPRSPQVTRHE